MSRVGALCAGYGGLELALQGVMDVKLAWYAEIDPAAAKVLALRFPGVPNLGDITQVDWSTVEPVDIVTAGFPCTDLSLAGRGDGLVVGTRSGLWFNIASAIDDLRPSLVIIENVRGLLSAKAGRGDAPDPDLDPLLRSLLEAADAEAATGPGRSDMGSEDEDLGDDDGAGPVLLRALGAVLGDLADRGFDAEWTSLRAADVGACHGRARTGVLAWPASPDAAGVGRRAEGWDDRVRSAGLESIAAAYANGQGREGSSAPRRPREGGRDEGRAEPAWLVGGPDAAERGGSAHDADRTVGGERREPAPVEAPGGRARPDVGGSGGARAATHAHGVGLGADQHHLQPGKCDAAGRAAGDAQGVGEQDESVGGAAAGLDVEPLPGAVHRDRERGPAQGIHDLGRAAPELAWGPYAAAVHRWELILGRPAPAPTEPSRTGGQRLAPRFVEWMQGCPDGWVTDVPGITRNDMLRILGNGVVNQQFTVVITLLMERAFGSVQACARFLRDRGSERAA